MILVFFIYGLSFFSLGLVVLFNYRKYDEFRIAGRMRLIGVFGILHGINEWLDMFMLMEGGGSEILHAIRAVVLVVSFLFLVLFGTASLADRGGAYSGLRFLPISLLVAWMVLTLLGGNNYVIAGVWARYLLGLPGTVLTFTVLLGELAVHRDKNLRGLEDHISIAAFSFLFYGFFSGLIVPEADFFPASVLNYRAFMDLTGIPVQVFRALCAVAAAYSITVVLLIFDSYTKRSLLSSEERYRSFVQNFQGIAFRTSLDLVPVFFHGAVEEISGYKEVDILSGRPSWDMIVHDEDRGKVVRDIKAICSGGRVPSELEYRIVRKDGQVRWVREVYRVVHDEVGNFPVLQGAIYDISARRAVEGELQRHRDHLEELIKERTLKLIRTNERLESEVEERRRVEERMEGSLKEKEVLLREVHHRVKNNMQVIISLLKLQGGFIEEERYAEMFRECQNRIKSMTYVHDKLYQSRDLSRIDLRGYALQLVGELEKSYGASPARIVVKADVEDISIGIDTAIPCGLIITELFSNALKHAFPDGRQGSVEVSIRKLPEGDFELAVRDDGVGLPEGLDFKSSKTLGLQLVTTLAESQLQGELSIVSPVAACGTEVRVRFSEITYAKRY